MQTNSQIQKSTVMENNNPILSMQIEAKSPKRRGRPKLNEEEKKAAKAKSGRRSNNGAGRSKSKTNDRAYHPPPSSSSKQQSVNTESTDSRIFQNNINDIIDEIKCEFEEARQTEMKAMMELECRYYDYSVQPETDISSLEMAKNKKTSFNVKPSALDLDGTYNYNC